MTTIGRSVCFLRFMNHSKLFLLTMSSLSVLTAGALAQPEPGFTSLFDGQSTQGWVFVGSGPGCSAKDGILDFPKESAGDLFTDKEYADFVLRLEYKLEPGGNNGVGIRCPLGTPGEQMAYSGMEIQILDDLAPKHANIKPWQFNGSVYNIVPAKNGTPKIGEWNSYEITAQGRQIKVVLNGRTIVDTDLNDVHDPEVLQHHPGMFRNSGRIGFLGHHDHLEFRNVRIKELPAERMDNTPPKGFQALFNGTDLMGWKGLLAGPNDNPAKRAKLSAEELGEAQAKADQRMREHWRAENGEIVFDGKGDSLCTKKGYGDFEMLVDWKIPPRGDSGIYLRGTPQVQIWEPKSPGQFNPPDGSGGLYNNKKNPRHPLKNADNPVGEWNRFRIVMVGEKVHVFLNGQTVVKDTTLENYWEPDKPIYSTGQIELQNHGGPLWFKNIYLREIPRE